MIIEDEQVLNEFRGPGICEICRRQVRNREPHHIFTRGMGGANRLDIRINLLATCSPFSGGEDCHYRLHYGDHEMTRGDLIAIVGSRERMNPDRIVDIITHLRRLVTKDTTQEQVNEIIYGKLR